MYSVIHVVLPYSALINLFTELVLKCFLFNEMNYDRQYRK